MFAACGFPEGDKGWLVTFPLASMEVHETQSFFFLDNAHSAINLSEKQIAICHARNDRPCLEKGYPKVQITGCFEPAECSQSELTKTAEAEQIGRLK